MSRVVVDVGAVDELRRNEMVSSDVAIFSSASLILLHVFMCPRRAIQQ